MAAQIAFSEEQSMLLDTAVEFCRNQSPIAAVRAGLEKTSNLDQTTWQQMVELGWLGINVPAEQGGLGLGLQAVVPIVENMGRNLMATPYVPTIAAIEAVTSSASNEQQGAWLNRIMSGEVATLALFEADGSWLLDQVSASAELSGDSLKLQGDKTFVQDGPDAGMVIVSVSHDGRTRLVMIEQAQIEPSAWQREEVIDETRRSFQLSLDGLLVPASQLLPEADLKRIEQTMLLLLSAEIAGGMAGVLHVILDYLKTRKQFDRLIGSYQALKHPTVDILLESERAKSHLYHAATMLAEGTEDQVDEALRMAKAQGSAGFAHAADRAVQFHGGFGFTYECDAQLYLRRALWCQYQFGDERYQRQQLAPLWFD